MHASEKKHTHTLLLAEKHGPWAILVAKGHIFRKKASFLDVHPFLEPLGPSLDFLHTSWPLFGPPTTFPLLLVFVPTM